MTAESDFNTALAAFQTHLPRVGKGETANTGTYSYDYADLFACESAAMPLLGEHGLAFTALPTLLDDGRFVLSYALRHAAGHSVGGHYPLPDPAKSSPQQLGSAITYGRRYCFCSATGIAPSGEDDDGAKASDTRSHEPEPTPASLRGQIATIAKARGLELDKVGDEFAVREGMKIGDCQDTAVLEAFLRLLRDGEL